MLLLLKLLLSLQQRKRLLLLLLLLLENINLLLLRLKIGERALTHQRIRPHALISDLIRHENPLLLLLLLLLLMLLQLLPEPIWQNAALSSADRRPHSTRTAASAAVEELAGKPRRHLAGNPEQVSLSWFLFWKGIERERWFMVVLPH